MDEYLIGVVLAILAGAISNSGIILQKRAINRLRPEKKENRFFRSLIKNPIWFAGLVTGMFAPAILGIPAQFYIGPTLMPGLQASGLIVLAIGSVRINKERLDRSDTGGILLMIIATFFIGVSGLSISILHFDFNAEWFLVNTILFTLVLFVLLTVCAVAQKGSLRYRAVLLVFGAGFMFVATNFWISPLSGTISRVFQGMASSLEWIFFLLACIILPSANLIAIAMQQTAYKYGDACILNTIQLFPTQITPIFVYLLVFEATPPSEYSVPLLLIGVALVISSSYLLMKRKAELREAK